MWWLSLVMSIRCCLFIQLKELPEVLPGEVSLHIFLLVHHTAAQSFLVRLPLEDLFFNGASLMERSPLFTHLGDLHVRSHNLGDHYYSKGCVQAAVMTAC